MPASPESLQSAGEPSSGRPKRRPSLLVSIAACVLLVIGLYAAFGFWLAPRIIKDQTLAQISERYHRQARLGEVRLNPFTLQLTVDQFDLPDIDGRSMIGFDRLVVAISPASIWRGGLVFSEISLDAPRIRLVRRADGKLNLLDLAPTASGKPQSKGPPPKLMIDHLAVRAGQSEIVDLDRPAPYAETFKQIHFTLNNFSTTGDGAGYALKAVSDRGEGLVWRGRFGLAPLTSEGGFSIEHLKAQPLSAFAANALPFAVTSGEINLSGGYRFALGPNQTAMVVDIDTLRLSNAGLRARGENRDWVTLGSVTVSKVHIDVPARAVSVGLIEVSDPAVTAWTEHGGINLARFTGSSQKPVAAASPSVAAAPAWTVGLRDLRLEKGKVDFEDRSVAQPVRFSVTPIDIAVTGLALPIAAPVQVKASAALEGGGQMTVAGTMTLDHPSADLQVGLTDVGLPRFQPYVDRYANLRLLSGRLSAQGHAVYAAKDGVSFDGGLSVDDLHTVDKDLRQDFVNWAALRLDGVSLKTQPFALNIRQVIAQAPYARVVIGPNYVMNINAVLNPNRAARPAATPVSAAPSAEPPTAPAPTPVADVEQPAAAPQTPSAAHAALPITIGLVKIDGGRMDFADLSIKPHFAAGIQNLAGTIKGLSGRQDARAVVSLAGRVDRYAPVTIDGQVNYFAARSFTDLKMSFQNMELTSFSPYSGKFAGYQIDKGKMSVDLHYLIDDQKLDATHHVVIDQLQLGDRVDSSSAVKLPVKLLIALLKDRNGVIDLPIEVTGTLDDPKFKLWPLIWKVVDNLLIKVATAPFALLGHLVGGGQELSYVDFAPGVATPDDAARQKLGALAKGLIERPAVNLDIPMSVDPLLDRPALIQARFVAELSAEATEDLGKRAAKAGAIDAALAAPRTRRTVLERLYRKQFDAKPDIPKPQAAADGVKPDTDQAAIAWLENQLRGRLTISDQALEQLGRARAAAVQDVLLGGGQISPSRVFVITAPPQDAPVVRMTLSLS